VTDARAPSTPITDGALPRWRTARPGRPASGMAVWAGRAPAIALLCGIALVAGAVVAPLAHPPVPDPITPPQAPRITLGRMSVADRERALASLTARNLFSVDGRFWTAPEPTIADEQAGSDGVPGPAGGAPVALPVGAPPLVLTNAAEMPPDIKAAFENLRLIGVRSGSAGVPVALIALVTNLTAIREHAVGSEFIDEKFAQAAWRIVGIDTARDRVELERAGKRVSLALYPAEPIPVPRAPEATAPDGAPATGVAVVSATPDQVARELREAGVTDAEIAELLRLMKEDPAAFAAAQAASADAKAAEKADEPEGLGAVLELMRSASEKKKGDAPPPADPPGA
jgi:hypothetical protein